MKIKNRVLRFTPDQFCWFCFSSVYKGYHFANEIVCTRLVKLNNLYIKITAWKSKTEYQGLDAIGFANVVLQVCTKATILLYLFSVV